MIAIVAIDNHNGMMFFGKRQSQDRALREKILFLAKGNRLWVNSYTGRQFGDVILAKGIMVDENFLEKAGEGEYCFVENIPLGPYRDKLEKMIIFRWNRDYPGDMFLDIDVCGPDWRLIDREVFSGFSHENIGMEVYEVV